METMKRILSLLLAFCLLMPMLPQPAWAEETVATEPETVMETEPVTETEPIPEAEPVSETEPETEAASEEEEQPTESAANQAQNLGNTSGSCGDNATWTYYPETGLLEITGTGAIKVSSNQAWRTAYYRSAVTQVVIGEGITKICDEAFMDFTGLTSVTIADTVTEMGWLVFFGCSKLKNVELSNNLTEIPFKCFTSCTGLVSLTIPAGITEINSQAFSYCTSLTSLTIPETLTTIRDGAFYNCTSLTNVSIPANVTNLAKYAFYGCSNLTDIQIPAGVPKINEYTFYGCSSLTSVSIPDSVTYIDQYAFYGCSNLTGVDIPGSVTAIAQHAFNGCTSLETANIGTGVTSLGSCCFYDCSSLTAVSIPESMTEIAYRCFYRCSSLTTLEFASGIQFIGQGAFEGCSALTSVELPSSIMYLYSSAFQDCTSLAHVKLPAGIIEISYATFRNCENLTSIELPARLTTIGSYTFYGCSSLTSIDIPTSVTSIGEYAFYNCNNLANINLPPNLKYVNNYTFCFCYYLTSIDIPATVTGIGNYAFYNCSRLKDIYFRGDKCSIGTDAFKKIEYSAVFYYPSNNSTWTDMGNNWKPYCYGEHSPEYRDMVDSTCTEVGYTAGSYCKLCDAILEGFEVIEMKPHTEKIIPGKDSTCSEYGLTDGKKCAICGEVCVPQKTIEKKPHTPYTFPGEAPTCYNWGWTDFVVCYECGITLVESEDLPPEHTYYVELPYEAPTCTLPGYEEGWICYDCYEGEREEIPPTGHTSEILKAVPATCTKTGLTAGEKCSVCSTVTVPQETIPAKGHSYVKGKCKVCGAAQPNYVPAPEGLTASNIASTGKIKLTWKAVDGAVKYQVYRSTSKNGTYKLLSTVKGTNLTNTSTTAGTCYYYKVRAIDSNGYKSDFSSIVGRHCDLPAPVVSVSNVASTGKIKLTWKAVDGAVKYQVYRSTSKNGTYKLLSTVKGTNLTNTSTTAGTTYYYKVKAIHSVSNSNSTYSSVVARTCDCAQPKLKIADSSLTSLKISWDKVTGAQKYAIYRSTSKDGTYSKVSTVTGTSYTDKKVTAGKTYYYKATALGSVSAANSASSSILSAKAGPMKPKVSTTVNVTSGSIKISWVRVSNATGYYVYRRAVGSSSWIRIATVTSGNSYKDSLSGQYEYSVAAYIKSGSTTYTSSKSTVIRTRTLSAPSSVSVSGTNGTLINQVSWSSVSGATGYQVYCKVGKNGSWSKVATVTSGTSYNHSVTMGDYRYYKVRPIYQYSSFTSYGPFKEETKGMLHYDVPNITIFGLGNSAKYTSSIIFTVSNKGSSTVRFYSDGTFVSSVSDYDRRLILVDKNSFATGQIEELDYVDIPAGESEMLIINTVGGKTYYDPYGMICLKMLYDGMYYSTSSSYAWGFSCIPLSE